MSLLIVSEEGVPYPELAATVHQRLEYRFIEDFPNDGFAGWEGASGEGFTRIDVAAYCRDCDGGFRAQGLNRFLAQAGIRGKPAAVVVFGLWGCTIDLPRIARMMGVPSVLVLSDWSKPADAYDDAIQAWLRDAVEHCRYLVGDVGAFWGRQRTDWLSADTLVEREQLPSLLHQLETSATPPHQFSYSTYEFLLRDHPLLLNMQQADVKHFTGSDSVLDIGCGAGIFLDCLRRQGIRAVGIERDSTIADYGRGMGLDIVTQDAITHLETTRETFDGIYCSHFVEHLPIEAVENLLKQLLRCVQPDGVVVLVFPDPESIRSQLLGFWRDPEHVRFYHPELIASMAVAIGFTLEWSSYDEQPHEISSFPVEPPGLPELRKLKQPVRPDVDLTWIESVMAQLGWRSSRSIRKTETQWLEWVGSVSEAFNEQQDYIGQLRDRTEALWRVNQTWAWNDNVTIRLRRVSK